MSDSEKVEKAEPRTIGQLLELGTYQGMTDEEIESLIFYFRDRAVRNMINSERVEVIRTMRSDSMELSKERHRQSQDVLKSVLGQNIPWVTVGGDSE